MSEPFLGQIQPFGFNFPPRGWAHCNGQLLAISSNTALFSLLGTTFGGDGRTTFGLPATRGRTLVGVGTGPGLDAIAWGQKGGSNDVTLTVNQMPSHNHVLRGIEAGGTEDSPSGHSLGEADIYNPGAATAPMSGTSIQNNGGSQPHNNMQPFIGIYYSIATVGIFPSRS